MAELLQKFNSKELKSSFKKENPTNSSEIHNEEVSPPSSVSNPSNAILSNLQLKFPNETAIIFGSYSSVLEFIKSWLMKHYFIIPCFVYIIFFFGIVEKYLFPEQIEELFFRQLIFNLLWISCLFYLYQLYYELGLNWTSLTFKELYIQSRTCGYLIHSYLINETHKVLLLVSPSPELLIVLFALVEEVYATPIIINPYIGYDKFFRAIEQSKPDAIIAPWIVNIIRNFLPPSLKNINHWFRPGYLYFIGLGKPIFSSIEHSIPRDFSVSKKNGNIIIFTSGSTGHPKPVCFTLNMFQYQLISMQQLFPQIKPGQTAVVTVIPWLLLTVATGMKAIVPPANISHPSSISPKILVDTIQLHQARIIISSPIVWKNLVKYCISENIVLSSVILGLVGGAPVPIEIHDLIPKIFSPNVELVSVYGATEAQPISAIGTNEILNSTNSQIPISIKERTIRGGGTCVGKIAPLIEAKIIRISPNQKLEWDRLQFSANDEIGEIIVSGPTVSSEYIADPESNSRNKIIQTLIKEKSIKEVTWHRTGDLGYIDKDKRLWYCGRVHDRIELENEQNKISIPTVSIENIFNQHSSVSQTALLGSINQKTKQKELFLIVELKVGVNWNETLKAEILKLSEKTSWSTRLSQGKLNILPYPKNSSFPVDATHNSKIRRDLLSEWLQKELILI